MHVHVWLQVCIQNQLQCDVGMSLHSKTHPLFVYMYIHLQLHVQVKLVYCSYYNHMIV